MTGRRLACVVGSLTLVAVAVAVVVFLSGGTDSRPPPAEPARAPAEEPAEAIAPPRSASPAGTLLLTAPPEVVGTVPVAVVGPDRIIATLQVPIGQPMRLGPHVPAEGGFLVWPFDNLSGRESLRAIHDDLEWPRPLLAKHGDWPMDMVLDFRKPRSTSRIRVVARTTADQPCVGLRFRVEEETDFSTVDLPVAFVETDAEGVARSPALARGAYRVCLQKPSDVFRPLSTAPVEVVLADRGEFEVRFECEPLAALVGQVRMKPWRPCAVTIREIGKRVMFSRNVIPDNAGRFQLDAIPPGRYFAVTWPGDHMQASIVFEVAAGRPTSVVLEPAPATDGAEVFGRLLDSAGKPLPRKSKDMNINAPLGEDGVPYGKGCRFDKDGCSFHLSGVSEGPKLAILWRLGYLMRFEVPAGAKRVDLGVLRVPEAEKGVAVAGQVLAEDDLPVDVMVCLASTDDHSRWIRFDEADGAGNYRFESIPPGRYEVWNEPFSATNYVRRRAPLPITVGLEDVRCDLRLDLR